MGKAMFRVYWSKTYYASGVQEVYAENKAQALQIAESEIGDYSGSMQYDADKDIINIEED